MSAKGNGARILLLAERDGWYCNGCGDRLYPYDATPEGEKHATVDHKDPDGGESPENLWLMCLPCNSSKHRTPLEEWEKTLDFDGSFLRRGFTQIPNTLLYDATVSMGARMTLICLMQFAWKGDPFPGQERLGQMLGVTDRTIRDYLSELREAGYIKVYRRGRGKTNVYRIVQLKLMSTGGRWAEDPSVQKSGDRKQSSALDRKQSSGKEYEVEEDEVKPIATTSRNGRPKPTKDQRDEVWDTLTDIFGPALTRSAEQLRGKHVASLAEAGATRDEIMRRAKAWPAHFDSATLTAAALEKHWDTLGRKPLRRR